MENIKAYPKKCRKNIIRLMLLLNVSAETAYEMLRMTAILMDLDTSDNKVFYAILMDCNVEDICI